ncbi:hypothetical protein C5S22_13265, partial [Clostridium perfringens]
NRYNKNDIVTNMIKIKLTLFWYFILIFSSFISKLPFFKIIKYILAFIFKIFNYMCKTGNIS